MKKYILLFIVLSVLLVPVLASAQPSVEISDLDGLIEAIENVIWVVFGLIVVIAFVTAGILFLTASGDPEKIKLARTAFIWGVVGVVVGIIAYSILRIVEAFF